MPAKTDNARRFLGDLWTDVWTRSKSVAAAVLALALAALSFAFHKQVSAPGWLSPTLLVLAIVLFLLGGYYRMWRRGRIPGVAIDLACDEHHQRQKAEWGLIVQRFVSVSTVLPTAATGVRLEMTRIEARQEDGTPITTVSASDPYVHLPARFDSEHSDTSANAGQPVFFKILEWHVESGSFT